MTNRGATDAVGVVAGIPNWVIDSEALVRTIAHPGYPLAHFPDCFLGDCSPRFIGFQTPRLRSGSSVVFSVVVRILSTPGATIRAVGFVATSCGLCWYGDTRVASTTITVAGSGALPSASSRLFELGGVSSTSQLWGATDAAFDTANSAYLVAGHTATATVVAILDTAGNLAAPVIDFAADKNFDSPRAAYSASLGAGSSPGGVMLVSSDRNSQIYARGVATATQATTNLSVLGTGSRPQIAYSQTDGQFVAVWAPYDPRQLRLVARRFGLDGQPTGSTVELVGDAFTDALSSTMVWNPVTNEFGLAYMQRHPAPEPPTLEFARLRADGSALTRTRVAHSTYSQPHQLAVNTRTGEYVLLWRHGFDLFGAEIRPDGDVVSRGLVTDRLPGADVLSLSYNRISDTFLVVMSESNVLNVLELNQYGAPLSPPIPLDVMMRAPAVAARPDAPEWRVFGTIGQGWTGDPFRLASQLLGTQSFGGGSTQRLGGCFSPDPFTAFGGGACFAGGWLPPGLPAPGTAPPRTLGSVPPPPPPPPPGGCTTPDPFVALGGGTCRNGGWLPPGMSPPPPPAPGGCTTPDPFVALGGGTCYNGGWLPPGISPPAPPAPGGCTTPDPFVAIGGGTCIGGGWIPRQES